MVGAPIGSKNALGNKGGKPYSQENREKAATLKGLILDEAEKIMRSKSKTAEMKKLKEMVINRLLPTCVPRTVEVSGEDGGPIQISSVLNELDDIRKK